MILTSCMSYMLHNLLHIDITNIHIFIVTTIIYFFLDTHWQDFCNSLLVLQPLPSTRSFLIKVLFPCPESLTLLPPKKVFLQKTRLKPSVSNRRSIPRDHAICRGSRPFHHRRRRPNSLRPASVPSRIGMFWRGWRLGGWDRFLETRRIMWVYYVYYVVYVKMICIYVKEREGDANQHSSCYMFNICFVYVCICIHFITYPMSPNRGTPNYPVEMDK